ncbi:MAG: peptide chain release factor N(5)-glutamine methyltransferase [bacterium]|nr:peptide chain release factor N(5)-glutamine methyltransferase [bacterium]MDI1336370.1 peptide chain release factor N(5)-glutamine methyltransferase [Lacunisphaera sp.]
MLTVLEIIKRTTEFFEKRGVESARLNAELLIGHSLGLKRMALYLQFERPLTEPELEKIRPLVKRRGNREPLQYITGETEFAGLKLKVDARALIPRPETERLIEILQEKLTTPPACILDLGTGSGAIALALAKIYPEALVTAVDQSEPALALARENAGATGLTTRVSFLVSDWFSALPAGAQFQLIVANPPYLSDEETRAAQPEVKDFEPLTALSAGANSAAALGKIITGAKSRLVPGGLLACETGLAQHPQLLALAAQAGFSRTESLRDLTGRDRYLLAFV